MTRVVERSRRRVVQVHPRREKRKISIADEAATEVKSRSVIAGSMHHYKAA